ncbi:MDR family MFS transporter [Paenibacillus caseinilyticus]|uniref:Multidrug transporter n=1 Tax=Paenibacillus mucilaginosus K02 TaxID=997761 RepID=I0BN18_9BACL|nr:MDR family MFS transporter [Paenibacillus mucilaginosus]AFH63765.1 multidrug transporter [Paenibacillus mucilaginosus K02]
MVAESKEQRLITWGLLLGLILSSVDQTIVAAAMPNVLGEWGDLSLYSWAFSVYMLASTVTMPIYGRLADLFGRKITYMAGMGLFLLGSLLCGMAGSMASFIAFRGVQGLGAGALMPIAFTIAADVFPPERRGRFMGLFSAVFAVSSIVGPALGGWMTELWSWRGIFWIQLPIGAAALYFVRKGLHEDVRRQQKPSVDGWGALLLAGGVTSLLTALVVGGETYAWGSAPALGWFAVSTLLLGAFIGVEMRVKEPLIPLRLFRLKTLGYGSLAGFFVSAGMFGAIAYVPLYVQGVMGLSASTAGSMLIPLMLSAAVTSMACGRWMLRTTFRGILLPSLALMLAGFLLLSRLDTDSSLPELLLSLILTGLGMGAVYPALGTAAQHAVDWQERGAATSCSQFFRSIGGTIGVSVLGSLLAGRMSAWQELLVSRSVSAAGSQLEAGARPEMVLLDPAGRASLPPELLSAGEAALSSAIGDVFLAGALFVAIGLAASTLLGSARLVQRSR